MSDRPTATSPTRSLRYRGDQIVLSDYAPPELGPAAVLCLDLDGDGEFEREVCADGDGLYTVCIGAAELPAGAELAMRFRPAEGEGQGDLIRIRTVREAAREPAGEVPVNRAPGTGEGDERPEPEICTCTACPIGDPLGGGSLDDYTHSYTPAEHGVELATGRLRSSFPITSFDTRLLGFRFGLHHASLVDYDGPWGRGVSHGFNMMIVQTDERSGHVVTPDLRRYPIVSEDGESWSLPRGFFSRLRLDTRCCRWTMTHFSGLEVEFFQGVPTRPGYPVSIREPNDNVTRLGYDGSGRLHTITTDLGQPQTLEYGIDGRLDTFTDHIGRSWRFRYDDHDRLTRIVSPTTRYADIAAGQEITEADLPYVLVRRPRTTKLVYGDDRFPSHITAVRDPRGATPVARSYDDQGRVEASLINGRPVTYTYGFHTPLGMLDPGNTVTRVEDREHNVTDHEIHGPEGGPVEGRGRFGLRRTVTWTERGRGNPPLRENEPEYWERRWLHDCRCLAPAVVTESFSSADAAVADFDELGIPTDLPRTVLSYNRNRQVTDETYTDGTHSIRTRSAYQEGSFGDEGQFSRRSSWTDPRAFDDNPIYADLDFLHTWAYDERGNRIRHDSPTVTLGVDAAQEISESWTYNDFGQVIEHVDPNGNRTRSAYFDGPSTGGDINAAGEFGGYLATISVGTDGSADPTADLTTSQRLNPLGMVTERTDPNGLTHRTEYDDLQEKTRQVEPEVTLMNGERVRYETRWIYDGAGNPVMERRSNVRWDGSVPPNAYLDRSTTWDAVGNKCSERVEVDEDEANDLIERFAYDGNDDPAATRKPRGNRTFWLYDERRLRFKTFRGVAPGSGVLKGYPADRRARNLGDVPFVGLTTESYDGRGNVVRNVDGRGNTTSKLYDFHNRQVAEVDPNGNGWVREYDDASHAVTVERGAIDPETGALATPLDRTYHRFDQVGRRYLRMLDLDLESDRRTSTDPDDGLGSAYRTVFDAGSRTVRWLDANGNPVSYAYDSANRLVKVQDAVGSTRVHAYDANSNLVAITEVEVPGPGAGGTAETYAVTLVYDALDRRTEHHVRGLDGNGVDHATCTGYDSRHNPVIERDPEANWTLTRYDDADRITGRRRYDGDPSSPASTLLSRYEWRYDRNGRVTREVVYASAGEDATGQVTRHGYDDLDRLVVTVHAGSDDPLDGDPGGDGVPDRVAFAYDPNSNITRMIDPRGVVYEHTFDAGNRLAVQDITRPSGVEGTSQQRFGYDRLDRITDAANDYARVEQEYDPLSRLTRETQSQRLDGAGFRDGWQRPIRVEHSYDRQSNRTVCRVADGDDTNLTVTTEFDPLNRAVAITAAYFDRPLHDIARYAYIGPRRERSRTLGNGAVLALDYDAKRRARSHRWTEPTGRLLVGFEYGSYNDTDCVGYERFLHDGALHDHFRYNDRYELTGVTYRSTAITPPAPTTRFFYDDVFNRRQAAVGDPFGFRPHDLDCHASNRDNEYVALRRNGVSLAPEHDRAGNATRLSLRPAALPAPPSDRPATARWDAFDLLFDVEVDGSPILEYRYDPFRRRIASLTIEDASVLDGSRRFIYSGWNVVTERRYAPGTPVGQGESTLERVYVHGRALDRPLLTAIDGDADGVLGDGALNEPDPAADQEYYYLDNRMGSTMALLDADAPGRVLEYCRYTAYGEPTVVGSLDLDRDRDEDTPFDLADNVDLVASARQSRHGNVYLWTGRRFDAGTGLYYYRNRYYDPRTGRFLSRDPWNGGALNGYAFVANRPTSLVDPLGLDAVFYTVAFHEYEYIGYHDSFGAARIKIDARKVSRGVIAPAEIVALDQINQPLKVAGTITTAPARCDAECGTGFVVDAIIQLAHPDTTFSVTTTIAGEVSASRSAKAEASSRTGTGPAPSMGVSVGAEAAVKVSGSITWQKTTKIVGKHNDVSVQVKCCPRVAGAYYHCEEVSYAGIPSWVRIDDPEGSTDWWLKDSAHGFGTGRRYYKDSRVRRSL